MTVPAGFFDPSTIVPGFESLGHYLPQIDAEALRMLVRYAGANSIDYNDPFSIAEVGSFVGTSTVAMAKESADMFDRYSRIYCIDTWRGSGPDDQITKLYSGNNVYGVFSKNTDKLDISIRPMPSTSTLAAPNFENESLDLVFIDADHSYEAVKADIAAWEPKVRPGGILCGHDYGVFPGVTRAVNERTFCGLIGSVWFRIKGLD